jgi:glycosyltransferase involved in cell wall biosynthesis
MRILFCTLDYAPSAAGGAERQARLQAEGLARRGHEIEVVCPRVAGHRSGPVNGVQVHRLPRLPGFPLRPLSYLFLLCVFLMARLRRFDLVHVHLANLQADVAVVAAEAAGRPSYLKVAAGGPLGEIGRLRRVARITRFHGLRNATIVQAISDEIARDLVGIGVTAGRIVRIPNGVDVPDRTSDAATRAAAREHLDLPADGVVVLFTGRMEVDKGVEDLIALWRAGSPIPDGQLLLVGSQGLKHPVALDQLPTGVVHRSWTTEVAAYLRAADIFVLPSYAEGMSNALLEAMASGLPVVASRVGAAAEMISDGETGLLVAPGDLPGLATALGALATDPGRRERIGTAARESVTARYGIDAIVTQIEAAYRSAVPAP